MTGATVGVGTGDAVGTMETRQQQWVSCVAPPTWMPVDVVKVDVVRARMRREWMWKRSDWGSYLCYSPIPNENRFIPLRSMILWFAQQFLQVNCGYGHSACGNMTTVDAPMRQWWMPTVDAVRQQRGYLSRVVEEVFMNCIEVSISL